MGIALTGGGLAAIAVPLAVLGSIGLSRWLSCDGATLKQAQKAALDALRADRSITPDEIDRTTKLLRENRRSTTFQPAKLAAAVASRTLPQTLIDAAFGSTITLESPGVQRAAALTLTAAFDIARHSDRYQGAFTQDLVLELLQGQGALATTVASTHAQVAELLSMAREDRSSRLVSEALFHSLVKEYAPSSKDDLPSAYAGLRQALAEAAEMKARAALPQNTGDAVQAVLRRVAELNERGLLDAGQTELDDALGRLQAQRATLLDQAATQARLRNDPATAARHMVDRLRIDAPDTLFDALRALQDHHYVIGLRQGIGFDLALSIDLARHSHRIATTEVERGTALNDLAIALQQQGTRTGGEAGTALLAEAVAAYRQALEVFTRADHPVDWAMTMQNLAGALQG